MKQDVSSKKEGLVKPKLNMEHEILNTESTNSDLCDVSGGALPNGWMDWNELTLDEMVEYLRNKYMFSSSGDAKCIYHLIEFYDNHKQQCHII